MRDAYAQLLVAIDGFKKMSAFGQVAAVPSLLSLLLNLLGKIIDEVEKLKGGNNGE